MFLPLRILRFAVSMDLFEQESHVVGQSTHGLHPFAVQRGLAFGSAEHHRPVLGGDDRTVHQVERHQQGLCRHGAASPAAYAHRGHRFVDNHVALRVEHPLKKRQCRFSPIV